MIAGTLEVQMLANMARLQSDMDSAKRTVSGAMDHIEKSVNVAKNALGALGIGLSAGFFVALIKGSIDAADHLNDLSKSTNIVAGDLAGLQLLARQSGTDVDGLAKAVNKMSVEMGKDPAKFRALGITAKDNVGALKQFADIFNQLPDINQRNALAQAVFSKSWTEMAPVLSEGGQKIGETIEKGRKLSGITADMTREADAFNDKWVELTGTGGLLTRQVAPLLPLLNALADDMLTAQEQSGGLTDDFHPLAEAFRAVVILGGNVSYVMRAIGTEAGGLAAQMAALARGDFAAFSAIGDMMKQDAEAARAAFDAWEKKMLAVGTAAATAVPPVKALTEAEKEAQKAAAARAAEFLETQKKQKDAYEAIQKKAADYIKTLEKEAAQLGLTAGQKKMVEAALIASTLKTEAERQAVMAAAAAWVEKTEATEAATAAAKEAAAAIDASNKALTAQADRLADQVAAAERALEVYGLTESQITDLTLARLRDLQAQEAARDADEATLTHYQREIDALERIRAAKFALEGKETAKKEADDAAKAWQNFARDLESSLTDALMRSFEAGDSFGEAFADNLKNIFKTMLLKAAVQISVGTVAGGVSQALGINIGSGGGSGNLGGLLSSGSSLYNAATGGGIFGSIGGFGLGAASAASELALGAAFVGPSASLAGGAIGAGATAGLASGSAGAAGAMSSLAAAAPYAAAALAVASIFGAFDKKKPAPIEWALLNRPEGFDFKGGYGVWNQYSAEGPFGEVTAIGQHLKRNGQSVAGLKSSVADPIVALDKIIAQYLDKNEIGKVSKAVQYKAEVEHGFTPGEVDAVMAARLNRISNAIGGWVDELFDTTTGKVQQRYQALAQILAIRGDAEMEQLAQDMFAANGKWSGKEFATLAAGVEQFNDLFRTDAERLEKYSAAMRKEFDALNLSFPDSLDGFKALVDGIDKSTTAGFELYTTLIGLAPTMSAYYDALKAEMDIKSQLAAINDSHFATAVDYRRYQGVAANYDPMFAADYAYNISTGAVRPGAAANDDIVAELRALRSEQQAQSLAIATNTQDTAKLLRRWNGDGMPETRVVA